MEKIRVYELARELDTNSKRLMEKLAEIGVIVKNHMSLLEETELDALYRHIGMKTKTQDAVPPDPGQSVSEPVKPVQNASETKPAGSGQEAPADVAPPAKAAAAGTVKQPAAATDAVAPGGAGRSRTGAGSAAKQGAAGAVTPGASSLGVKAGAKAAPREAKDAKENAAPGAQPAGKPAKAAPRIIRTTEINLDRAAREEKRDTVRQPPAGMQQAPGRDGDRGRRGGGRDGDRDRRRRDYGRSEFYRAPDSNAGLIAGFTRMTHEESIKQMMIQARAKKKRDATEAAAAQSRKPAEPVKTESEIAARMDRLARIDASVMAGISKDASGDTTAPDAKTPGMGTQGAIAHDTTAHGAPALKTDVSGAVESTAGGQAAVVIPSAEPAPGVREAVEPAEKQSARGSAAAIDAVTADKTGITAEAGVALSGQSAAGTASVGAETAGQAAPAATVKTGRDPAGSETAPVGKQTERAGQRAEGEAARPDRPAADAAAPDRQQAAERRAGAQRPAADMRPRPPARDGQGQQRPMAPGAAPQGGYAPRPGAAAPGQARDAVRPGRSQPRASFDGRPYQQDQSRGGQPGAGTRPQDGRPGAYQQGQAGARRDGRPFGAAAGDRPFRPRDDRPVSQGFASQGGARGGDRPYQPRDGFNRQPYAPGGARPGQGQRTGAPATGDRRPGVGTRPRADFSRPGSFARGDSAGAPQGFASKTDQKRDYSGRDTAKSANKDLKRDSAKPAPAIAAKSRRFKPQATIIGEKKGVQAFTDDEFIINEFYETTDDPKRGRRQQQRRKALRREKYIPPRAILTSVTIGDILTVKELAETLKKTASDVILKLMSFGMKATANENLDFDTAALVAAEFGIAAEKEIVVNEEDILFDEEEAAEDEGLTTRPPVVVVMGHVDHGKTSLLDAIRKTNVISSEAGGITQHIGAYMVNINGRAITFLDTPGHEAFTSMRARGAMVTDIAVLVVSAVDGVMPQTVEAINHAKAARVSLIVAINMIDREGANPGRVMQELTEHEILVEDWGGDVIAVPVSAKTGENIEQLLEMILLTADVLELKANPERQAKGTVIEAKLDKNRGPVATLLVQRGTLNVGDSFITGATVGRIRAMLDDNGVNIQKAGPSMPVEIIGLSEVPVAGEVFYVTTDDKVTKSLAEKRRQIQREEQLRQTSSRVTLDDLFSQIQEGKVKELNLIIKADVQGSVEAVRQSLEKLGDDEVRVNIIHSGVGAINESDVSLASVSSAIIIGFNVRPGGASVIEAAEIAGIDVRLYTVIYNAIEDIQAAMKGLLDPTFREVVLGHVEVRQIFRASGVGTIGGCYVLDGKIQRSNNIRVLRDGVAIFDGRLASLRRFKDDAREVMQGFECGIAVERFNDIKENDIIEPYTMEEIPAI